MVAQRDFLVARIVRLHLPESMKIKRLKMLTDRLRNANGLQASLGRGGHSAKGNNRHFSTIRCMQRRNLVLKPYPTAAVGIILSPSGGISGFS